MEQGLVLLLLGFASFHSATGLNCYVCTNFRTDQSALNTALAAIGTVDEDCSGDDVDVSKLKSVECPSSSASCIKTTGDITASYSFVDVTIHLTVRECLPTVTGTDGCTEASSGSLVESLSSLSGLTIKEAKGTVCLCSGDNCNGAVPVSPSPTACSGDNCNGAVSVSSSLAVLFGSLVILLRLW